MPWFAVSTAVYFAEGITIEGEELSTSFHQFHASSFMIAFMIEIQKFVVRVLSSSTNGTVYVLNKLRLLLSCYKYENLTGAPAPRRSFRTISFLIDLSHTCMLPIKNLLALHIVHLDI